MARITVVDDIAVNRALLVTLLTSFGHRVSEAADGASALERVREEQPDLIICDILMPQMDGDEFVRCLRADPRIAAIPVIQSPLRGSIYENESLYAKLKDYANELEAEIEEHKRTRGHLAALYGVAQVLNAASSVDDATERLLAVACPELGFSAATLWRVDEADGTLQCIDVWCRSAQRCAGLVEQARSLSLTSDRDLVEDASPTDTPLWLADLRSSADARRRQAVEQLGIGSGGDVAIMVGGRVTGMLEVFRPEPGELDGALAATLVALAGQIGAFFERIANQDRLAYLAQHDELTGLPNRAHLLDHLCAALQAARHHPDDRVGVVVWDVSRFRNINDSFGRQVGDTVLRELAHRLAVAWPNASEVARIGVDQFAAVISGDRELTEIAHLIEDTAGRILDEPVVVGEHELHITVSAGIALGNGRAVVADTLISNAEAALRKAKGSGIRYRFYGPEMNALIAETLLRENRLRQAIERDAFVLHYQPRICGISGEVTGLEALLRWNDPTDGLVYPDTFIPILEDSGMIIQVGLWAIRKALAETRVWQATGLAPMRVAVNVSALQLQHPGFVDSLRQVTDEFGEIASWLDLEITESVIMTDLDGNASRLAEVRRMGIEIAIDDFGTGYSSLSYLAKLPVNALKIDRSFVAAMSTTPESMTIPTTIISLAHALGLKVIAEGVEEESQASALRRLKCNELQGYLFSRPLPPEQVVDFVQARIAHVGTT